MLSKYSTPEIKAFYENIYLDPNSDFNKYKAASGGKSASGPFGKLTNTQLANLNTAMVNYKRFLKNFDKIKREGLIDLKELNKLVGGKETWTTLADGRKSLSGGVRAAIIGAATRTKVHDPVAKGFLKNVLRKKLKLQKLNVGQGQPTWFIKDPRPEGMLDTLKDYYLRRGAKEGITPPILKLVKKFHKNITEGKYVTADGAVVKPGEIIPRELLPKGITENQAAWAQYRLAQIYEGKKFPNVDIEIPLNKKAADSFFALTAKLPWGSPYKIAQNKDAYNILTRELGQDYFGRGDMDNLRRRVKKIFKKEGIRFWDPKVDKASRFGVNVNEIIGTTAASRIPGAAPYSQFFNLLEGKVNTADYALFQRRWEEYLTRMSEAKTNTARAGIIKEYNKFTKEYMGKDPKTGKYRITDPFARKTLSQTGFPTLSLKSPEHPSLYGIKETARLREQGLDLLKAFEKMKFTIGVKKGTPVLKDVVQSPEKFIAHAKKILLDQVEKGGAHSKSCELLLSKQTGGIARTCAAAINKDPIGSANKLANLEATSGPLAKVKDVARGFLGVVGKFGARAAPLAAVAALGVGAEPLVKQFRSDDYSTYLSDPEQQGSMLLAMVEQETPKVDQEILKWQMPALGAATAAGAIPGAGEVYKARRALRPPNFIGPMEKGVGPVRSALGIKGVLGKALGASFSPLAVAATLPLSVAAQRKGGTDWDDIATDPSNWFGPAFAASGADLATKGMKSTGILAKAIRMGMSPGALRMGSRFLGMPGLALTAGMWGYDKWKNRGKDDEFKVRRYIDDDDE